MERPLRLNLGNGDKFWPGFNNCDKNGYLLIYSDYPETVDEIHAIHLFEHLNRLDVSQALKDWKGMLKPNGLLVLEMPSMDKIAQMIVDGEKSQRLTLLGIFGNPKDEKPDMMHHWCYQNWELEQILTEAGFHQIDFMEPVYHMTQRDLRVECRRKE